MKGYSDTEFRPDEIIIREQIAAIMHRYAQYKGYDVSDGENINILTYDDAQLISSTQSRLFSMRWAADFLRAIHKGRSIRREMQQERNLRQYCIGL